MRFASKKLFDYHLTYLTSHQDENPSVSVAFSFVRNAPVTLSSVSISLSRVDGVRSNGSLRRARGYCAFIQSTNLRAIVHAAARSVRAFYSTSV